MKRVPGLLSAGTLLLLSSQVLADDMEGSIESLDTNAQTFVLQGITFKTTDNTDYDDGLTQFADLEAGLRVEVDFTFINGIHYATEIELDKP